jgi:hypothetical protein
MPNWNKNFIKLTGTKEKIAEAKALFESKEQEFDFNKIIPMPESEKDNWYDWCTANWGTKWNAVDVECEVFNENCLTYSFDTAWCLPEEILRWFITSDFLKGYDSFFWESSNEEDMYETYESYILDAEKGSVFREVGNYNDQNNDPEDVEVVSSYTIGEPIPMREEPNDDEINLDEVPF